jgi:hypothetical protein
MMTATLCQEARLSTTLHEPTHGLEEAESIADALSGLDSLLTGYLRLAGGIIPQALRLAMGSRADWMRCVQEVAAGRGAEVHAARSGFEQRLRTHAEIVRRGVRLVRAANQVAEQPLPGSERLGEALKELERLQTGVLDHWQSLDDLEELAVAWFPLPSAKLEQLAPKLAPPQSWYDEEGQPF